ncbi:zinc ribbon domain-containing protein [Homoserinimonas sp. A447]
MAKADPLAAAATELYALPLDEFTKARNAKAADARDGGDRELADRIRQLKKPTVSAWAVNMLSRHRSEEVGQLLELGAALREAQSGLDADELRALGKQRQQLISAVVKQARTLAAELGGALAPAAADEVGQTLQAALADPNAAEAVTAGVLTGPLVASGWGSVDVDSSVAVPSRAGRTAKVTDISERQRAKAKRRLTDAEEALEKRESEAENLDEKLDQLRPKRKELEGEVADLQERIAALQKQLAALDRERDSLKRQREKVASAVGDAALEVDEAAAELKRLT